MGDRLLKALAEVSGLLYVHRLDVVGRFDFELTVRPSSHDSNLFSGPRDIRNFGLIDGAGIAAHGSLCEAM